MFDFLKQKITTKFLISFLAVLCSLIWLSVFSFPDNKLHLVFCDVGQGDAILITKGFSQILIDGGPNDKVMQCLANNMPFFDRKIEIIALTHPEADHLTGLLSVLDKYEVDTFLTGPEGNNSAIYTELKNKLQSFCKASPCGSARGRLINPYTGETIKLGDIVLQTLWPEKNFVMEKLSNIADNSSSISAGSSVLGMQTANIKFNQFSLVFLLDYQKHKVLLMGDADQTVQDDILLFNSLMPIDILKFPHHGSKTGLTDEFLQMLKPKEAVISVGKNSYGHPTNEALSLLEKYNVKIRRTDLEREIHYEF